MEKEILIHDWVVQTLKERLSKEYKEIKVNIGEKKEEFKGFYPDLILMNHGIILAIVEVETEKTITEEAVQKWKQLVSSGVKLTLMIPKKAIKKVTALLWDAGIAEKVSIGNYEILINMP